MRYQAALLAEIGVHNTADIIYRQLLFSANCLIADKTINLVWNKPSQRDI
ncbi:hypothetical protein MNY68_00975 [Moellerella wisconsensis]|nr:hypothetical protein [Moellerella wisconsensis]UNH24374.1 hypothetical protein MNY68_00975 [Moellerella wisconsensis]